MPFRFRQSMWKILRSIFGSSGENKIKKEENNNDIGYDFNTSYRKGKWMQIKLEKILDDIDSVGIIFRRRSLK